MPIATLTCIPASIEQGSTALFTESFADYPVATWAASLVLARPGDTPLSFAATVSGGNFLFTLSAAATALIAPGWWDYAIYVTASAQRACAKHGRLAILNDLALAQTPSPAQQMLTALETAITTLSGSVDSSVSFNGQSFTRASMGELIRQRVSLQAEVIREKQALAAIRGTADSGFAQIQFRAA